MIEVQAYFIIVFRIVTFIGKAKNGTTKDKYVAVETILTYFISSLGLLHFLQLSIRLRKQYNMCLYEYVRFRQKHGNLTQKNRMMSLEI